MSPERKVSLRKTNRHVRLEFKFQHKKLVSALVYYQFLKFGSLSSSILTTTSLKAVRRFFFQSLLDTVSEANGYILIYLCKFLYNFRIQ
jgi:hypothetical protein